jgi:hypothetical protein
MFTQEDYTKIKQFVEANTWFQIDGYDEEEVSLTTRENGSVYNEEPGDEDIEEAIRLCKEIQTKLGYEADWDVTDEWVNIYVRKR